LVLTKKNETLHFQIKDYKMIKLPLFLLFISIFLNCNQAQDANSKDSGSSSSQNKMLYSLLNPKNGPKQKEKANHPIDFLENYFNENNKTKEYRLKLAKNVLLENTSKTFSLSEESIACTVTGTMKITTSIDLAILTKTDTYNKTAELSNEKRTVVFDNCSNDERMTIKSGTIIHTQTTKSKLTIATASSVMTETITEGVESISGSKVLLNVTPSGTKETTAKFAITFTTTKKVNTYTVDSTNTTLTSYTPVSVVGVFGGTITHTTPTGDKTDQINKTINKTF
jgi:hypothetical protein